MLISIPFGTPEQASQCAIADRESLRAEAASTSDSVARARLFFELGASEDALGNTDEAAKHYLAAAEANKQFREPLQRLVAIERRQRNFIELGKHLEQLLTTAETPDEQQQAVLARSAWLTDHGLDPHGARALLQQWLTEHDHDTAAWLMLELLATRQGDQTLRATALTERAVSTSHPLWRALLLIQLSQLHSKTHDTAAAKHSLELAIQLPSTATYRALVELERVCRTAGDADYLGALETTARLIANTLTSSQIGDDLGVPISQRSREVEAALSVLVAHSHLNLGNLPNAKLWLDQALAQLPNDRLLQSLSLNIALLQGDSKAIIHLAHQLRELNPSGTALAMLWLRTAEAESVLGNSTAAIEALRQALSHDAQCWVARALLLELLLAQGSPAQLASSIDDCAQLMATAEGKVYHHFAAAEILARHTGQVSSAADSLNRALITGKNPGQVHRVTRFLATLLADTPGTDRSTEALCSVGGLDDQEQRDLCLLLVRTRLLQRDASGTQAALDRLAQGSNAQNLVDVARAYAATPFGDLEETAAQNSSTLALTELADRERDSDWKKALQIAAARRTQLSGSLDQTLHLLRAANDEQSADVVIASYLASQLLQHNDPLGSAQVLRHCASTSRNLAQRAALHLQAGLLFWQAKSRDEGCADFDAALQAGCDFPSTVAAWCRSAVAQQSTTERAALASVAASDLTDAYCQLQQFVFDACISNNVTSAQHALDNFDHRAQGSDDLRVAGILARSLWATPGANVDDRANALSLLEEHCSTQGTLTAAATYLDLTANQAPLKDRLIAARNWSETESSLAAACEWLAMAHASGADRSQADALLRLSALMPAAESPPVAQSAHLLRWLTSHETAVNEVEPFGAHSLESALPGSAASERAKALTVALNMYPHEALCANTLIGFNHLEAGELAEAEFFFRAAAQADPHDLSVWEGLREVALRFNHAELLAEATAALGDTTADPISARNLWEQSSEILLDSLDDQERGTLALARAVDLDPSNTKNFERLIALVRKRRDDKWLVALIDSRLGVIVSSTEQLRLYWDKARALRRLGELDAALSVLDLLRELQTDHAGALALAGEIHLTRGNFTLACETLGALSRLDSAPMQQRQLSGLCAADIAADKFNDCSLAIEILLGLCAACKPSLPVREGLVRLAAQAERWDLVVVHLQELLHERTDVTGRIAAARLLIAVHRDRLGNPDATLPAVESLLKEAPDDGEVLDLILTGLFPSEVSERLLTAGMSALLARLHHAPDDLESVLRLATIAARLGDSSIQQIALGAALALGHVQPQIELALVSLGARSSGTPKLRLSDQQISALYDPLDQGPLAELCELLAPSFARVFGPNLAQLELSETDKLAEGHAVSAIADILAWAEALGVMNPELFIGKMGNDSILATLTSSGPAFVVGPSLRAPLNLERLQWIARQVLALRRGILALCHQSPEQVASVLTEVCQNYGDDQNVLQLNSPSALVEQMQAALSSSALKRLPELVRRIASQGTKPLDWALAAQRSLDRASLLATGDISWVKASMPNSTRSAPLVDEQSQKRLHQLLKFAFSTEFVQLRNALGLGPK